MPDLPDCDGRCDDGRDVCGMWHGPRPEAEGRVPSTHGEWDKAEQRYEDGCKSGTPEHDEPGRVPSDATWRDLCADPECLSPSCPDCARQYARNRRSPWWKRLVGRVTAPARVSS